MRFMVAEAGETSAVFLVEEDRAINLSSLDVRIGTDLMGIVSGAISAGDLQTIAKSGRAVPVSSLKPAMPIRRPGKFVCLGLNYLDHIKEGGRDVPEHPTFFLRTTTSLMPAGADMVVPKCSEQLDYEGEMLVIIGKGGRHISEADALGHIFGYSIFNDGSVRNYQRRTSQFTPGKNFDATGPVGPIVVTPDELPAGGDGLKLQTRINGEVFQDGTTSDMMYSTAQMIAAWSEVSTLEPGDMLATGTPPGVGFAQSPPRWLRPGDVVEVEIERIGMLRNPVVGEA